MCVYACIHIRAHTKDGEKVKYNYTVIAAYKEFTTPLRKSIWMTCLLVPLETWKGLYFIPCPSLEQLLSLDKSLSLVNNVC